MTHIQSFIMNVTNLQEVNFFDAVLSSFGIHHIKDLRES